MINSARFEPEILAAVKPGVDGSLAEISQKLELYLKAPAQNIAALETVCDELHRMLGVLKMVGLEGLVVYCTEFERALNDLKANPKQVSDLHRDVLRRALFAVTHFLDALAEGADNATLRLFPQYHELQQLRGMEMAFELDLFYPNLAVQLPPQILKPPQQEGAKSRLKVLRIQYQQGLLKWLRQEDVAGAIQLMQQAVGGAIFCEPQDSSRGLWWASYVLFDCLKIDALPSETNVRKLLGRIDQLMRMASEGDAGRSQDAQPVMNEMLYLIAHVHIESDQVKAIKQVYSLEKYLPEASALQLGELDQQLGIMRDQLRVAEESWDLCVQGDKAACEKFSKYVELIKTQSEKFDRDTLQYLAGQLQELSHYVTSPEHARPVALDMAMALLLLASGIENYNHLGSGFQQQARILSERMHATVKQQPEDEQRMTELVDLHYQMDQQGDVMASLANEMLVNLQHVEEGLNAFFNDVSRRGELAELLRLLNQIQGGFSISSLKHAGQLLAAVQKHLSRFSQPNVVPRPAERYALADAMSALENYMQHLTHGQSGDVSRLLVAMEDMEKLDRPEPAAPPATAKKAQVPSPAEPGKSAQPQVAPAVAQAPVAPAKAAQTQAPVAAQPAPVQTARAAQPQEQAPATTGITEQIPAAAPPREAATAEPVKIEQPLEFVPAEQPKAEQPKVEQPKAAVPVAPARVEQPKAAPALSEEEQELLDIFLEEAQEVLAVMGDNLGTCKSHPDNHEALVAIRRGFHTLKGSGRMVGLTDLGEVAWSVERAMNKWLQEKKPATPGLLKFIGVAQQSFSGWVAMLQKQGNADIEAGDLVADAQKIEEGIDLETAEIPAGQPEPQPPAEPVQAQAVAPEPQPEPQPELGTEQLPKVSYERPVTAEQAAEPEQPVAPEPEVAPEVGFEIPAMPEQATEPEQLPEISHDLSVSAEQAAEPEQPVAPEPEVAPEMGFEIPAMPEQAAEPEQLPEISYDLSVSAEQATEPEQPVAPEPEVAPEMGFEIPAMPEQAAEPEQLPEISYELSATAEQAAEPEQPVAPEPELAPELAPEMGFEIPAMPEQAAEPEQLPEISFELPATAEQAAEPERPVVPAPAEEEELVTIGGIPMPQDLFEIASLEAMQNVSELHKQYGELRAVAVPKVQYDFMRAAHTLGGVCRTLGIDAVVSLAHALEEWLREHVDHPSALSQGQMQLLEQSIAALDEMVQSICLLQLPQERNDLSMQLMADKGKPAVVPLVVESMPAEAALPQAGEDMYAQLLAGIGNIGETVTPPAKAPEAVTQPVAFTITKPAEESAEAEKAQVYDDIDDQLLPVFLEEAEDLAPKISEGLRAWRESPQDEQLEHSLKRVLHTMKGSSRMVGAMRIGEISHQMETHVMSAANLRDEPGYWDKLESEFDRINALLEELRGGKPVVEEIKPEAKQEAKQEVKMGRRASDQAVGVERRADRRGPELGNVLRVRADVVDRLVNEASEISVVRSRMETEIRTFKEGLLELTASVQRLRQQLREVEIQAESQMQARVSLSRESAEQFDPLEFDRFTRLQELTRFMNESVHDVQTVQQTLLKNLDETASVMQLQARLNRELQQGLMNVRMVSFNSITDRLYRIVRQTCKELNKRANLELQGTSVELDRSVLEKMIAPFEHLLRNSIVHGLESDIQRERSGKNPIGEIRLSVRQESNEVVFEFSDDGAGLNYAKLREKAIAKGTMRADEAASDDQLAQLIFMQGISTAAEINEIAGRGVGMDVVRSEIAALGGRIDVSSKRGQGTQFTIRLPLTLAVTNVVMVRSGETVYAIPSTMVEQVRQVKMSEMEVLHREKKIDWQGSSYPLHYLPHLLGNMEAVEENQPRNAVLLIRSGEQRVALHVDELLGNQEAMVKNIGPQLARLAGIAGATVMGNGEVVLILNPPQLAQRLRAPGKAAKEAAPSQLLTLPVIMVVDDSLTVRKITSRMLTRAGYQVVTATDGMDALEKLAELGDVLPEVMLLDIEMPRMDGFALAKHLRRDPKTKNLPIIMITSRTADKHRDYAMQLGVNTYLGKPYQEDELLQNIADFVAAHKLDA